MIDLGSKFFTWAEALASQNAARLGLDNTPDVETQGVIVNTARHLDEVRVFLERPIHVSSWYRSLKVNAAAGSKPTSQHVKGEAVDFTSPDFGTCDEIFAALKGEMAALNIDQLIREFPDHANGGWIHVSFNEHPRHSALIIDRNGTRAS